MKESPNQGLKGFPAKAHIFYLEQNKGSPESLNSQVNSTYLPLRYLPLSYSMLTSYKLGTPVKNWIDLPQTYKYYLKQTHNQRPKG